MSITFLIQSNSINLERYTIKDVPGSSGRLDVIARCVINAVTNRINPERNIKIIFFNKYKNLVFDSDNLDLGKFPKNELRLSDLIVKILKDSNNSKTIDSNVIGEYKGSKMLDYIKNFIKKNEQIFVLRENGKNIKKLISEINNDQNITFIIGNQSEDLINSEEFQRLNLPEISLGSRSYLASQVIRLIKILLLSNK
ncbi:MAG: hypothetical protein GF317_20315 [Candidatus Lokiarchaeota archaeon]|nr:hypothetical protein [Candidatus Lokiarchaeota archaeon]MBD3201832.1 hypothetical protein [Candidatus Lokiarchaeota archaeon]